MSKRKKDQADVEVKADMKVLLELEHISGIDGAITRMSLGSYVEEVMPDGYFLIKMPIHRGYHYPLPRNKPLLMYLFAQSRMFSMTVQFLERIEQDNLMYAKVRKLSGIKSDQRRDCFRLQCTLPVMAERPTAKGDEPGPPFQGQMQNFSDGGMAFVTNASVEIGETLLLTFDIGTVEMVDAKVLRLDKAEVEGYRKSVAVKFTHKCKKQKDRFYKYIITQQREILRKQAEENELLKPD